MTVRASLTSFLIDGALPIIGAITLSGALGLWSLLLLAFYPASALVLRGTTGRSIGDRVAGLVYSRAATGARPGVLRCLVSDLLVAVSWLPLADLVLDVYAERLTGLRVSRR